MQTHFANHRNTRLSGGSLPTIFLLRETAVYMEKLSIGAT